MFSVTASLASANGTTAFKQAVVEAAGSDKILSAFYRDIGFQSIWTGNSKIEKSRRKALLDALETAESHGLPAYELDLFKQNIRKVRSDRELGHMEVEFSKLFLEFAGDLNSGILNPRLIDEGMVRRTLRWDMAKLLTNFAQSTPSAFLRKLGPQTPEYARLRKQKLVYEQLLARGGWGAIVPGSRKLEPGDAGSAVIALRNRLISMGYLPRTSTGYYDDRITDAVKEFQKDHGLAEDGIAGKGTISEINKSVADRLASILVAMERERWLNMPRGERHVWVNLADFSAAIIDNGRITFKTRSVVGANKHDRRSPEFSDTMEYMVINPSWFVPRSITVKEYLPLMQENPSAVSHLQLLAPGGQVVSRNGIDFSAYDEQTFPFDMKQPPSQRNALGLVKFMFPNRYNIYLHDTPEKHLFSRERRAFSHGCIRLHQPFEFAYTLLARQSNDPKGVFHAALNTGVETTIYLKQPIPVHLGYRTAITNEDGSIEFRRDVYGRDAKIFAALQTVGVELSGLDG